jgi:hypothetical protein
MKLILESEINHSSAVFNGWKIEKQHGLPICPSGCTNMFSEIDEHVVEQLGFGPARPGGVLPSHN